MLIMGEGVRPDDEEIYYDGFLYIISQIDVPMIDGDGWPDAKYSIDVKCLNAEYDDPISLVDIAKQYPHVHKVIFDDCLKGYVYNYGNHGMEKDAEMWERVGTTVGYA